MTNKVEKLNTLSFSHIQFMKLAHFDYIIVFNAISFFSNPPLTKKKKDPRLATSLVL